MTLELDTRTIEYTAIQQAIVVHYAAAAFQTDDLDLRSDSGAWLGFMKYNAEHDMRTTGTRGHGEGMLHASAAVRLPFIDKFIDEADADNLRDVIDGFIVALDQRVRRSNADPSEDCVEFSPQVSAQLQQSAHETMRLFLSGSIDNATQSDDVGVQRDAAEYLGATKMLCEVDLRRRHPASDPYGDRIRMWTSAVTIIDDLIVDADTNFLRALIQGMTTRIRD